SVGLQVTAGGGIVALRSLDSAIDTEGTQKRVSAELVARELRITLGQLPGELGEASGALKVFGQTEMARQLIPDLTPKLQQLGLSLETATKATNANFDGPPPPPPPPPTTSTAPPPSTPHPPRPTSSPQPPSPRRSLPPKSPPTTFAR